MSKTIAAIAGLAVIALVVLLIAVGCTFTDNDGYYPHGYYPVNQPHTGDTGFRTSAPRTGGTAPKTGTGKPGFTPPRSVSRPGGRR
jgi:hypothetical protein